jgi:hypothetical protein
MMFIGRLRPLPLITATARTIVAAVVFATIGRSAGAATLQVCRTFDQAAPPTTPLLIPVGSLFRDDGRVDDPLAAFGNDRWQLRLVTATDAVIAPLQQCVKVQVRVTSDSSVKSVSVAENRGFIYIGSDLLIDRPAQSEELLSATGRVLDQVP